MYLWLEHDFLFIFIMHVNYLSSPNYPFVFTPILVHYYL